MYSRVLLDNDLCETDRRNTAVRRFAATALQDATVMSLEGVVEIGTGFGLAGGSEGTGRSVRIAGLAKRFTITVSVSAAASTACF